MISNGTFIMCTGVMIMPSTGPRVNRNMVSGGRFWYTFSYTFLSSDITPFHIDFLV
jgi:hypothetical protein